MTHHGHFVHHGHHHHHHHNRDNTNIVVTTPFVGYGLFSYFRPSFYTSGQGSILGLIGAIVLFLAFIAIFIAIIVIFKKKYNQTEKEFNKPFIINDKNQMLMH